MFIVTDMRRRMINDAHLAGASILRTAKLGRVLKHHCARVRQHRKTGENVLFEAEQWANIEVDFL